MAFLEECLAVLTRTPAVLDAMLRDLPEAWTMATEGEGTWSPYVVVGHLIHGERADWVPRVEIILRHGRRRPFDPFDRESPSSGLLPGLLDEFRGLRHANLERIRELDLRPAQLDLWGAHPALGEVTLRQLLAMWTAHDLSHIVQIKGGGRGRNDRRSRYTDSRRAQPDDRSRTTGPPSLHCRQ